MIPQPAKDELRPLHTAAFYEMRVALGVAVAVLMAMSIQTPAVCGGIVTMAIGMVNLVFRIQQIRSGKLAVPKLNPHDGAVSQTECRYIERSLIGSTTGTVALAILIVVLISTHRLTSGGTAATIIAFNIYGWFAYSWWREAWYGITLYKEARKALRIVGNKAQTSTPLTAALPRMTPTATPEPLQVTVGKSSG